MRGVLRNLYINTTKLFTAFSFYKLRSSDLIYFQYVFPTLMSIAISVIFSTMIMNGFHVKLNDILLSSTTLMGVLVGFYIAALAAVTSFPNTTLDSPMKGDAPYIKSGKDGQKTIISRRRFLSIILGYCAFLSIFIYIVGSISAGVDFSNTNYVLSYKYITATLWIIYCWILCSLLVTTMLGLHYLIDRMHRD